jgi:ABC-2 type transport system ATP-binding protein
MEQALRLRGLTKTYPNGLTALRGIDLDVAEGDFFALLGPNGAGKSTAIGIICSLVNKTAGSVSVFGHDIHREPAAAKRCIGLVPQEFNFNVFEPVVEILVNQAGYYGIHRDEAHARAEVILRQLGLWEKRRVIPRNLSGGMKRRLMIARSLVHQPRLLILDEPTAGVDIEIRHTMWEFLRKLNADGTTIILTTHYLEEAESLCRRIAIINEGALIENTSMKQLLKQLHMETFVLDIKEPVGDLPAVAGCAAIRKIDELTLEADVYREDSLNALFAGLGRLGIEVLTLRNKSNRLEQLFMGLVSQKNGEASRQ